MGLGVFRVAVTFIFAFSVLTLSLPGQAAIINGDNNDNILNGTGGDDVITAFGGNDLVTGQGGNDVIDLGPGNDTGTGNAGNDTINGGPGDDTLVGDTTTFGGPGGNDILNGGPGIDHMQGGAGADTYIFNLGDGQDTLVDEGVLPDFSIDTAIDVIVFGMGILSNEVSFSLSGQDLILSLLNTTDSVTVQLFGHSSLYFVIEQFQFGDGVVATAADVPGILANGGFIQPPQVAVPEPGTLAIFGIGLIGLGALRHRQISTAG